MFLQKPGMETGKMKKISEKDMIEPWVDKNQIRQYFDTPDLVFEAFQYEKGEMIISPEAKMDFLLFLIRGTVIVYSIQADGRMIPIHQENGSAVFGDVEYNNGGRSFFYCEAATRVVCVALSASRYRQQLDKDLRFLHHMLRLYVRKISLFARIDAGALELEEKVLSYMRDLCPEGEMKGMDANAMKLRCSRRQLQRVLKKLCEEGRVEKTGRGRYRLA